LKFTVLDFSDRIEVRPSDEFIANLKTFTKEKKTVFIHYKSKRPCEKRRHYWIFPEKEPIGKRLFGKWNRQRRQKRPHEPFITISQLRVIHQKTGISYEELEAAVTHVRVGSSSVSWSIKLPIFPNEDWAFLFGLWYSAGGYVDRERERNTQEKTIRYALDKRPYDELIKPILTRLGYTTRDLVAVYYTKRPGGHKMDQHKWRQFGSEPRGHFVLHRPFREILEKFGLPECAICRTKRKRMKGKSGFRCTTLHVPDWVRQDEKYTHAFVEGYLNGQRVGSQFHPSLSYKNALMRFVEPRFGGKSREETERFYKFFADYFSKRGITGYKHNFKHRPHPKTVEIGYLIHSRASLKRLYEQFNIRRPDTRARLLLNYYMNPLLYEACRKLNCFETLVLGLLIETPQDIDEITETLRCQEDETIKALEKLGSLKIVTSIEGKWTVQKIGFRRIIIPELKAIEEKRKQAIYKNSNKFFSRCDKCGNIIPRSCNEPCDKCNGNYKPISRFDAMRKLGLQHGKTAKILTMSKEKIPSLPFSTGVN